MPVVARTDEARTFLVVRYCDRVTTEQVLAVSADTARMMTRETSFSTLLIFDATVDLSDFNASVIDHIRKNRDSELASFGLRRRAGAAVVDSSVDANMVMPLWNALNEVDPNNNLHFELFKTVGPALNWLEVPATLALPVIEETER